MIRLRILPRLAWLTMAVASAALVGFQPLVQAEPNASEWRYCLAVLPETQEILLSDPLLTDRPLAALEAAFDGWLNAQGKAHEASACPTAQSPAGVVALRDFASRYNQKLGIQPKFVQWSPG